MDEESPLSPISHEEYFKKGLSFLQEDNLQEAFEAFEKAYNANNSIARYVSYYGLCLTIYKEDVEKGIEFCTRAIKIEFFRPEYYLNLGKAFLKAGKKQSAINTFRKGLKVDKNNLDIKIELEKIGIRAMPVIQFLERSNPINKYLGILFRRIVPNLLGRKRQEEDE